MHYTMHYTKSSKYRREHRIGKRSLAGGTRFGRRRGMSIAIGPERKAAGSQVAERSENLGNLRYRTAIQVH
jgi:hypothetical protein